MAATQPGAVAPRSTSKTAKASAKPAPDRPTAGIDRSGKKLAAKSSSRMETPSRVPDSDSSDNAWASTSLAAKASAGAGGMTLVTRSSLGIGAWGEGAILEPTTRRIREKLPSKWQGKLHATGRSLLAAVTAYWRRGGSVDKWTRRGQTSTGVALGRGVVAVDPKVIPYGSVVKMEGVPGTFVAADCGGDVIARRAVKKSASTARERKAIVVDVFFPTEAEGRAFDKKMPSFLTVKYYPPRPMASL